MPDKQRAVIWVAIFIIAGYFSFTLADKDIFSQREVYKVTQVRGYSQTYNVKKKVTESNPLDAVVKISLLLVATFAYWKVLGLVIPRPGMQLLVFIVSIPIFYIVFFYAAFATQFG